ncbi:histidine phosphatase family protein [Kiloniella laminariae]|uniref:histidine phosphatase family protein n=1 Tax=Kiloniella laminariae TaxID=454162 RepID=UPI0004770509|nr:histidine phosphatase family protein [Kiloniella laminariae]
MYLLRHGQSQFNASYTTTRIDPNIPDPELTDEGRDQAKVAGEELADKKVITRIIASPYTRALQTAQIVADILALPIEIEPLVREHAFFSCDIGSPASKLSRQWPHIDFAHLNEHWWPDLDETEQQVKQRCHLFQQKMIALEDWSKTLVVSHWAFIRGLTGHEIGNGGLISIDLPGLVIHTES